MNRSIVFFERTGTYRRWPYVCFLALFGSVSLVAAVVAIQAAWREGLPFNQSPGTVFAVLWLSAMLGISGFLAYRVVLKPATYSRIDNEGIAVDSRRWPWNEVKWVFLKPSGNGVCLCFQRIAWGPDHAIHGWPPLAPSEAEEILATLEDFLEREYPDVSVG